MKKLYIIAVLMLLLTTIFASEMVFKVTTETPIIRNEYFSNNMHKLMNPGEPMVAYKSLQILLPQGHVVGDVNLQITRDQSMTVQNIQHAQEPIPISEIDQRATRNTSPNRKIYENNSYYPYQDFEVLGVSRKKGYDIVSIKVYPYRYNPVTNSLKWASEFTLSVNTEYDIETANKQNLFLIANSDVRQELANLVINPQVAYRYQKQMYRHDPILPDPANPFQMIIISGKDQQEVFEDYIDWKHENEITTGFFTVEEIYENYDGVDEPDMIRNFIRDAYKAYSTADTPLEYVILGGDDNIIPIRGMYGTVGNYVDYNMPSDIYYSNLDGCWDANGNGIYGEPDDDVDWYAEIAIGRIPAHTDNQFYRFFEKTYRYVDHNTYSNDIVYMFGENLDNTPTWGGDYKDEIVPIVPDDYRLDRLYERDGTFSPQAVVDVFHEGLGIINHIGHANHFRVFGLSNSRISSLRNTEFGFAYTQGCYPAAFDNATSEEAGAVGQNLTTARGGLFAFIGNTRYGWYRRGTTNGPSQQFDITFFEGLYDEDIRELGHTMNYSKEVLVNQARSYSVMRWIYYQLVLFGDPSIEAKNPLGTFPYIEPVDYVFDDVEGDGDGVVNPGETIHLYVEVANSENWANADQATGTLSVDSDYIEVIHDSTMFGDIPTSDSVNNYNEPFVIKLSENVPYKTYDLQLKLEAIGEGNAVFSKIYQLPMNVTLEQKHWPIRKEKPIEANPIAYDFNNDGHKQIIAPDIQANIYFINSDTTKYKEPVTNREAIWQSTAFDDLTGDGELEIIVSSRRNKITAYTTSGDTLFSYDDCSQVVLTPVVADLNKDGKKQIIALDIDDKLHVLDNEGNAMHGFPIMLSQTAVADLAVADITGDGYKEIIAGTLDGMLQVIRLDGTEAEGFPLDLGDQIIASPIVLPNYDIVTATRHKIFLISAKGDILFAKESPGRVTMEIIAADFNNSHSLEFAYVTNGGYVDIVNRHGESLEGFPYNTGRSFLHPPLAADINGDGYVNLICHSASGVVYGFDKKGQYIDALPFPINRSAISPATIADIDNDGDLEIIFATSTGITVIDYKLAHGHKLPWTTYRANIQRTGFYGEDESLSVQDQDIPIVTTLNQNYPNPFNPTTRINFAVGNDVHTKLEVYNIRGQLVKTLVHEPLQKGHHSVLWNGVNNNSSQVGSGVYFYRLQAGEEIINRKMMLIK